jgi:hypothetical protein
MDFIKRAIAFTCHAIDRAASAVDPAVKIDTPDICASTAREDALRNIGPDAAKAVPDLISALRSHPTSSFTKEAPPKAPR